MVCRWRWRRWRRAAGGVARWRCCRWRRSCPRRGRRRPWRCWLRRCGRRRRAGAARGALAPGGGTAGFTGVFTGSGFSLAGVSSSSNVTGVPGSGLVSPGAGSCPSSSTGRTAIWPIRCSSDITSRADGSSIGTHRHRVDLDAIELERARAVLVACRAGRNEDGPCRRSGAPPAPRPQPARDAAARAAAPSGRTPVTIQPSANSVRLCGHLRLTIRERSARGLRCARCRRACGPRRLRRS